MPDHRVRADPGAVLLLGILLYSLPFQELTALLTAAAVHELGHCIALTLCGSVPAGIVFSISGPTLICSEPDATWKMPICALSGPAAGFVFWVCLKTFWQLCAEMSLLLSVINLLPILPLDGGRVLKAFFQYRASKLETVLSFLLPTGIMTFGLYFLYHCGKGIAFLMFGAWLLILSCQES